MNDTRPAEIQSGYEIRAASSRERLDADEADLWASGRVASSAAALVRYEGLPLTSGQLVYWKVRTFDSDGIASPWSEIASFEMGLLKEADWQAYWIASPLYGSRSRGVHVSSLRREFLVEPGLRRARFYVAALGDCRVSVNGSALAETLAGGVWSDYEHEHYYQTLELTDKLSAGTNVVGVLLGDGVYAGSIPGAGRCVYANRPALRAMLILDYASGRQVLVSSDHQWRWRASWILAAETSGGEHVDARQLDPGWDTVGYVNRGWAPVDVIPDRPGVPRALPYPPLGVQQALRPLALPPASETQGRSSIVVDFGEQVLGRVRAELTCIESDCITFAYALHSDFSAATLDAYTSTGRQGTEVFVTTFALHAFRFLRIEYTPGLTELRDVHALRVGIAKPNALRVRSDHSTLNQLLEVLDNTLVAVSTSVPLAGVELADRLPHAGLAGAWLPIAGRMNDMQGVLQKWIADLRLACELGAAAGPYAPRLASPRMSFVPDEFLHFEALAGVVWACYRHQGDLTMLRECYPGLRAAALCYRHRFPELLREGVSASVYGHQNGDLIATATMFHTLGICSRIADVLGNLADVELLDALCVQVRNAFRRRYLTTDGHLLGDTQSACVAALHHGLLEPGERRITEGRLLDLVRDNQYHTDVVPAVTHALLPTLTAAGRLDVAYMVLLQTSLPSWLGSIAGGERLIGRQPGCVSVADLGLLQWLQECLIGVALDDDIRPQACGYRSLHIRPMPPLGARFPAGAPVQFVSATLQTVSGQIALRWEIKDSCFELELSLPPNCKAIVTMPDGIEQRVQSGWHRFVMDFEAGGDGVPTLLERASG